MKNSLFKRAVAVASALPLALTQCLSVANAVYVDYSADSVIVNAQNNTLTLNEGNATSLLYIEPSEDVAKYSFEDDTFRKASNWNSRLASIITLLAASEKSEGLVDLSDVYQTAIDKSGDYAEVTSSLIDKIGDITYSVGTDNVIVIKGTLKDITPTFTAGGKNTIGGSLRTIGRKYGVADFEEPEKFFEGIEIGCDITVELDASQLANGTVSTGTITLKDAASGKIYKGTGAIDWAIEKFTLLKDTAKAACDKYDEIDSEYAYNEIDDKAAFYVDKLELANSLIADALEASRTEDAANSEALIAKGKEVLATKTDKTFAAKNCADFAANEMANKMYDTAINLINDKTSAFCTFDFEITDFAELGDSLENITASIDNGVGTITATFVDKEEAAVIDYFADAYAEYEVEKVYKEIYISTDLSKIEDANGGIAVSDIQIERVVEVKKKDVTTTTTDPNAPVVTTTTTDPNAPVVTTTTTDPNAPVVTTTTTDPNAPITTTTRTETVYTVEFITEAVTGFYLDIDPEFNIEQLKSLGYRVDEVLVSYGEDGSVVGEEVLDKGTVVDMTDAVEFKDVPADVFNLINTNNINQFAAQIQLYATKDITAADGRVIAKVGDALKNADGSAVSVTAYIGVKGDADLDMKADSADASTVLIWYANMMTGKKPAETQFSNNTALVQTDPMLDEFAAFLADVDNETDIRNYVVLKPERTIGSDDASFILIYYSKLMTGSGAGRETWNETLGK